MEAALSQRSTRSYGWRGLDAAKRPLATRSGLEYYQALRDGSLAPQPITETIGWKIAEAAPGRLQIRLTPQEFLFHDGGLMHGGILATLLDSAMSGAVLCALPKGKGCSTTGINVHFVRGVRPDTGLLLAEGRLKHEGGKTATAEGEITDEAGRLYAHGSAGFMIFDLKF